MEDYKLDLIDEACLWAEQNNGEEGYKILESKMQFEEIHAGMFLVKNEMVDSLSVIYVSGLPDAGVPYVVSIEGHLDIADREEEPEKHSQDIILAKKLFMMVLERLAL